MVIIIAIAVVSVVQYFVPGISQLNLTMSEITSWASIIAAWATVAASLNTTLLHSLVVTGRQKPPSGQKVDIYFSAVLLGFTVIFCILGFWQGTADPKNWYNWWYNTLYTPSSNTFTALAGLAIFLASYRGFKVRNVASVIFMVATAAILFNQLPLGQLISKDFGNFGGWLLNVVNLAALRGILIGLGVAAVLYGVRVLMTKEKGMFARE